jgi:ribonucleotide monophosphatase NagD (HAD superfamily)
LPDVQLISYLASPYLLLSDSAKAEVVNALHPDKDDMCDFSDSSDTRLTPSSHKSKDTSYDSVVIGLAPPLLDYEHLNTAFRILKREMPGADRSTTPYLLATHRARYIQSSTGQLSLGPGPFVAALENAVGDTVHVKVVGKPEAAFFNMVIDDFGDLGRSAGASESRSTPRVAVIGEADLGGGAIELGLWRVLGKLFDSYYLGGDRLYQHATLHVLGIYSQNREV